MASLPTVSECRAHLEGYNITTSIMSDAWITDERDNTIVPFVERILKTDLDTEQEVTEYYSGTAEEVLILNRRNVTEVTQVEFVQGEEYTSRIDNTSYVLIGGGMLRSLMGFTQGMYIYKLWPKGKKNIKVTYKYGGVIENDVKQAIKKLTCVAMLENIEGRTGGGALTVQSFSRNYGNTGKYHNIRMQLGRKAMALLRKYMTGVVGS